MSNETSVYIDALTTFGVQLYKRDSLTVSAGLAGLAGDLSSAMVGMVGTTEAQTFAAWNAGILEAFGYFARDASLGYPSLGGVAIIMASNYLHGDLSQGDAMTDVMDAFNPAAGTQTVDDISKSSPLPVTTPTDPSSGLPDPTTCKMPGQPAKPNSPFAKWQTHEDNYQKWETWRPVEPDPSPQQKATPPSNTTPTVLSSHGSKQTQQTSQPQPRSCKPSK